MEDDIENLAKRLSACLRKLLLTLLLLYITCILNMPLGLIELNWFFSACYTSIYKECTEAGIFASAEPNRKLTNKLIIINVITSI